MLQRHNAGQVLGAWCVADSGAIYMPKSTHRERMVRERGRFPIGGGIERTTFSRQLDALTTPEAIMAY